jgi:hypothetical protein
MVYHPFLAGRAGSTLSLEEEILMGVDPVEEIDKVRSEG